MKSRARGVLPHHPCVGIAHFLYWMRCQTDQFRIPALDGRVATHDSFANLHQCVLDVPRAFVVRQVLRDLLIGKLPAKPGVPPEEEGKQHDEPCGEIKKQPRARRHAAGRLAGRRALRS